MTQRRVVVTGGSGFIGTNLIQALRAEGSQVLNYDRQKPMDPAAHNAWRPIELLDATAVRTAIGEDQPHTIYHLAAETRIDGVDKDFVVNVTTTRNVLDAAAGVGVNRTIVTSTMLVHPLGSQHRSDLPGDGVTAYGRSKATMERMVRSHPWQAWTIVRPTTIWGPWHRRLADDFLLRLARGRYVHPHVLCHRSYGYVANVCHQLRCLAASDLTAGHTFFVGDDPLPLAAYVDAFSIRLHGRPARRAPMWLFTLAARLGDVLQRLRVPFPLSSYRLRNMTQDNIIDMSATIAVSGHGPIGLDECVAQTLAWWQQHHR